MATLVTCKFEDDLIKSECAIRQTTLSPVYVYGKVFRRSRVGNSEVNIPIWPEIKLIQDFMLALVTCMHDEDPIKK